MKICFLYYNTWDVVSYIFNFSIYILLVRFLLEIQMILENTFIITWKYIFKEEK